MKPSIFLFGSSSIFVTAFAECQPILRGNARTLRHLVTYCQLNSRLCPLLWYVHNLHQTNFFVSVNGHPVNCLFLTSSCRPTHIETPFRTIMIEFLFKCLPNSLTFFITAGNGGWFQRSDCWQPVVRFKRFSCCSNDAKLHRGWIVLMRNKLSTKIRTFVFI